MHLSPSSGLNEGYVHIFILKDICWAQTRPDPLFGCVCNFSYICAFSGVTVWPDIVSDTELKWLPGQRLHHENIVVWT